MALPAALAGDVDLLEGRRLFWSLCPEQKGDWPDTPSGRLQRRGVVPNLRNSEKLLVLTNTGPPHTEPQFPQATFAVLGVMRGLFLL